MPHHAGPDRYATTPARILTVALATDVSVAIVIGTAAGPRAGAVAFALAFGLPCVLVVVLVALCLLVDARRHARRRARRRVIPRHVHVDLDAIEDQALGQLQLALTPEPPADSGPNRTHPTTKD